MLLSADKSLMSERKIDRFPQDYARRHPRMILHGFYGIMRWLLPGAHRGNGAWQGAGGGRAEASRVLGVRGLRAVAARRSA